MVGMNELKIDAGPSSIMHYAISNGSLEPVIKLESASEGLSPKSRRSLGRGPGRERELDGCLVVEYEGAQKENVISHSR